MLSIGRLGVNGGAEYYLDKVANSVDDYYLGRGEAPGQWIGATAEGLGLIGQVDAEQLRNLLAGRSATGESLGVQLRPERRPGYDLTFSAPKGISLLWAFGPDHVRDAISVAHDRAVGSVLDYLSTQACITRRGRDGKQLIEAEGFIGAAFRHRTSRAGDPQLHTHVVVPNVVRGADGRWSAPDGRHLFTWKIVAGTLYQSALRGELAPLGLVWNVRRNGLSELRDIPATVLRAFSKRRADIEAAMGMQGAVSAKAAEIAALATRQRKPAANVGADVLRDGWGEQLATIELPDGAGGSRPAGPHDITTAVGRDTSTPPGTADVEEVFRILAGENGVSLDDWEIDEHQAPDVRVLPVTLLGSTFTRRDAICAVARAFDVTPVQAGALAARFLEREDIVRVLADPDAEAEHVRTRSGAVVPATSGDRRYTTRELLAAEQRIVGSATARIGTSVAQVPRATIDDVLSRHAHLDVEQSLGVRHLLTSGNGYDLVIGQAGTGKSTMLHAARAGWEESGYRVIGTAVAARTAADLERGTGIPSSSLTQLLADLREGGGLTSRHVIVVDEASMVGSRPLDQLRHYVDGAGAKLVLVGDNRQLASIDAGGALRTLSGELGDQVVTLTTNRRQAGADQQWERDALAALRQGDVTPAVHAYAEHGRVTITGTIDEARRRIVDDWWAVHHEHTTAILAVRRADVAALNNLVRAQRQAAGELGEAATFGTKAFSVGDRVIFEKNQQVPTADRGAGGHRAELLRLRNGTFGTVTAVIGPSDNALTREGDIPRGPGDNAARAHAQPRSKPTMALVVELDDGRRAVLPHNYTETSVSLGYALTVFRAQGITVDHTFGLGGDSLFQEAGYTQLSRGRLSNNLYVAAPENPRWEIGHHTDDLTRRDAVQTLVDALSQNREQTMAWDRLPAWPLVTPENLDAAYREHASLRTWLAEQATVDTARGFADACTGQFDVLALGGDRPAVRDERVGLIAPQLGQDEWVRRYQSKVTRWSELDRELRRHEYRLGQAAAYTRPEHITAFLGPLPERIREIERWHSAAGAIQTYRTRWGVSGPEPLGKEPVGPEQRSHWRSTLEVVRSAGFTPLTEPGVRTVQPSLSSMWERVDALGARGPGVAPNPPRTSDDRPLPWGRDAEPERDLDDGFGR